MREKIIVNDRENLLLLIYKEINDYGNECDLNHLDISNVSSMSSLFLDFNFNGDISNWDVSNVTDMRALFSNSKFNGDISNWDVSNVTNMSWLFYKSKFNGDVSNWRPLKIEKTEDIFLACKAPVPYWFGNNNEEVVKKIKSYDLFNKMNNNLKDKDANLKKMKI